jgi:hypothetical protein
MIAKIIAVIINEIVEEYRKLQPENHPDESVLSFSSTINPAQTGDSVEAGSSIGFNRRTRE